jgi:hypothetical protein
MKWNKRAKYLLFILFVLCILYYSTNSIEGFSESEACSNAKTLSEYAFLGIPKNSPMVDITVNGVSNTLNYWSQSAYDGINKQGQKQGWICNADGSPSVPTVACSPEVTPTAGAGILQALAVNDEAIYFGENGIWPYGSYITNYLNGVGSLDKFQKYAPTRFAYTFSGLYSIDSSKNPLPDSFKIAMGQMDPPSNYNTNTLSEIECNIGKVFE